MREYYRMGESPFDYSGFYEPEIVKEYYVNGEKVLTIINTRIISKNNSVNHNYYKLCAADDYNYQFATALQVNKLFAEANKRLGEKTWKK